MPDPKYPTTLDVRGPNEELLAWLREHPEILRYAEFGVYDGKTALLAKRIIDLRHGAALYLFDFERNVGKSRDEAAFGGRPGAEAFCYGNSEALCDSYCWSIGSRMSRLLREGKTVWDFVYLDGAHTWAIDGFAFMLIDRLLEPGGYVWFDDYDWKMSESTACCRANCEASRLSYTEEQEQAAQVRMIVELLAVPMGYEVVIPKKLYRKPGRRDVANR